MNDIESYWQVRDIKNKRVLTTASTQKEVMEWIEDLLNSVKNTSLLMALNEIQAECNLHSWGMPDKDKVFPDKFQMPLCIINLVLKEHGLKVEYV